LGRVLALFFLYTGMTKTVQQDISQNKYEKKKLLKHVDVEQVCTEKECKELKRKKKSTEEEVD
jgi:hypothetical protein